MAKEDEICRTRSTKRLGPGAARAILLLLVILSRPAVSEVPDGTWLLPNRVAIEARSRCDHRNAGRGGRRVRPLGGCGLIYGAAAHWAAALLFLRVETPFNEGITL